MGLSSPNPNYLTITIDDPIFSDREQQTFPDLFWLSISLGEHILGIWEKLNLP
ncbi:hypothetical protein [Chamaesiphon minutus]|uniref:hypothetical protein n=1 Tax=Chamaesiphon minutus TaxID=1173032 RepID=UPI0002DED536|nr:hypothetical protein [Chamaesiphon minutus]